MDPLRRVLEASEFSVALLAAGLTLAAALASLLRFTSLGSFDRVSFWPRPPGLRLLFIFLAVVLLYLVFAIVWYWDAIRAHFDLIYFGAGLFLAMIFGMFVRVMASNHQEGRPFFEVTPAKLLYPVLFSLIVFYPIWALAADAPKGLFPVHAAFLNGYFWESIVSSAKPQTKP